MPPCLVTRSESYRKGILWTMTVSAAESTRTEFSGGGDLAELNCPHQRSEALPAGGGTGTVVEGEPGVRCQKRREDAGIAPV